MRIFILLFFFSFIYPLYSQDFLEDTIPEKKDTVKYVDSSNVIFKIYTGDNKKFSRVVIQMESFPFREIEKQNDRIVVMLYNTVFGQDELKMESKVPMIQSIYTREMVKKHSQVIIQLSNPNVHFRSFQLLRPCRLVIDIFPEEEIEEKRETFADYLQRGKEFYFQEQYDKALANLRKAAINGKIPEAYYFSALIRFKEKDYPKATYNFTQALKEEENFADSYLYLAEISEAYKDYKKAVEYCDLFLKVSKDSARFSEIREKRQYYQDIIDRIIKMEELKEKQDSIRAVQGQPEIDSAEIDSFLTAYSIKESTGEEQPLTWFIWAKEYLEKEDFEKAVQVLNKLIDVYPESGFTDDSYLLLAKIYFQLSLYPQAKKYTDFLIKNQKNKEFEDEYLFMNGKASYFLGEWKEGEKRLKEYIGKFPDNDSAYQVHLYLARIYDKINRPIKRDEEYELALKLVPEGNELLRLYDELGNLFLKKEEIEKSIHYFHKIYTIFHLSKSPELLEKSEVDHALFILGDLYYQIGNFTEAANMYNLLKELFERDQPERLDWVFYQLGNIANSLKNYDESKIFFQKVISDYPQSFWTPYAREKLDYIQWIQEIEPKIEEMRKQQAEE